MTAKQIRAKLAEIEAIKRDYEAAHALEDSLMVTFIQGIAESSSNNQAVRARLVLKSQGIKFPRHCA